MPKGSMCSCLTLAYYQQFFDVDTVDVKQRLFQSAVPLKADFFARLDEKPDLYGPFWITTTLIFLLGMASNLASFLSFVPKAEGERWAYDFTLVTFSTSIIYGYVVALPVGLWLLMKYFAVPVRLLSLLCLYGYSLTVLVPVTIICVAPVSWLTWLFTSLAFAVSSSFLCRNLWKVVNEHAPKKVRGRGRPFVFRCTCLLLAIAPCSVRGDYTLTNAPPPHPPRQCPVVSDGQDDADHCSATWLPRRLLPSVQDVLL